MYLIGRWHVKLEINSRIRRERKKTGITPTHRRTYFTCILRYCCSVNVFDLFATYRKNTGFSLVDYEIKQLYRTLELFLKIVLLKYYICVGVRVDVNTKG